MYSAFERKVLPKLADVQQVMNDFNVDVFCLTETWLTNAVDNSMVRIEGYNLYRRDRDGRCGGGVAIYARSCFKCFVIKSNPIIEHIWISIRVKSMDLSVGCVYRPPNSSGDPFINTRELQLINCNLTLPLVFCLGDMNIDFLDGNSQLTLKLKQCLNSLNMNQLIKEPTRVARSSATLLYLIVTSDARIIHESIVNPSEISDHDLVYCRIKLSFNNTPKFITYRDFSAFDYDAFLLDLQRMPFHFMFNMSVDNKIIFFIQQILSLFDHHAPIRKVRITKCKKPWITENIKFLQNLRNRAKSRFKRTKSIAHWNYYKVLGNYTTFAIRNEKKAYFEFL
ncbi:hypothetical protein MML48_8g00001084 [Holotrichia oblita]|uniref:Uncharacterized protein n=1 Tax=Holotrichia oblita TaxID=644536 RepID=A0ACB9SL41_HOLOL|nr:hypothetical protein MML48_8g00001084 [Holotrichia oblita]